MGLNKKYSRLIKVESKEYRWVVQENDVNVLTVQSASGLGQKIQIYIGLPWSQPRRFSFEDPGRSLKVYDSITPSLVADLIRESLFKGWTPNQNGKTISASLFEEGLSLHKN